MQLLGPGVPSRAYPFISLAKVGMSQSAAVTISWFEFDFMLPVVYKVVIALPHCAQL